MTDALSDYRSIIENLEDLWINVKDLIEQASNALKHNY